MYLKTAELMGESVTPEYPPPSPPANRKLAWISHAGVAALILILILIILVVLRLKFWKKAPNKGPVKWAQDQPPNGSKNINKDEGLYGQTGEIVFCESSHRNLYDLRFILRSSVELLGAGSLGTTYKLILQDGSIVALKRLTEVNVRQKEFEQTMNRHGRSLKMKNILPVQSFYYSKGLKFVVYQYLCLGSVFSLLQGGRRFKHTPLDWSMRFSITVDVACALRNLHRQKLVHGNLKSSNILMTTGFRTVVSECGIVQMTSNSLADRAITGYRAPELADSTAPTRESDVFSFGVFLLELLTGISPNSSDQETPYSSNPRVQDDVIDKQLPQWVAKTRMHKSTEDIFDSELRTSLNNFFETTGIQTLHVAEACVSASPESRPSMKRVLAILEHIRSLQQETVEFSIDKSTSGPETEPTLDSESYNVGIYNVLEDH